MIWSTLVVGALALVQNAGSGGAAASPPVCKASGGIPHKPLVTNADAAKAIFLAVEPTLIDADLTQFPTVVAGDRGDKWLVARRARSDLDIRGGGQLSLTIAKCDAAISVIGYDR